MNSPKERLVDEILRFGEMGFDFVEITLEAPAATPEKIMAKRKEIEDALQSYNFGVLSHYPWYFSVAHPYHRIQEAILKEFCLAFDAASALGAKKATVHTEFLPSGIQDRQVHVAKTIESLKKLEKEAQDRGLQLLVENYSAQSFSIKDFKLLFSEIDAGMTFDVGHASLPDGEGVENYLEEFRKKILHVHLHDNDKKSDQHLPLGAGKIDILKVVKRLKECYDGTITLEVHSQDRDFLKISREKLEIAWFGKKKFLDNQKYLCPSK
ncbi:MAG: sugar phosphate isomerase/epimerase [Candidatus Anstonellaceae archaeon]